MVEIRGVEASCWEDLTVTGISCEVAAEQSSYVFQIVAEGYQTIDVSHELLRGDCGGACCCCGYTPAILPFTLVPVTDSCTGSPLRCCVNGCGSDGVEMATCVGGAWTCLNGVPEQTCAANTPCNGAQEPPASSLTVCADPDAGVCFGTCPLGEICFTQVTCGPVPPGGGTACAVASNPSGDNRCHRTCSDGACGPLETCQNALFFSCGDYNGSPTGRPICCPPSGCP